MSNHVSRYASYTYDSPNFLVRYPHRKRNKLVAKNINGIGAKSWLDFGAGDGALLGELHVENTLLPCLTFCYEPVPDMYAQLAKNVTKIVDDTGAQIKLISTLSEVDITFDLITALEVLEHLPLMERIKFYCFLANNLNEDGVCLIEVPIEFGPILLLKEFGRKFLKNRVSEYSSYELINAVVFGKVYDAYCRHDLSNDLTFISPHRGFNLNRLLFELDSIGDVQELIRSPFPALPRGLNQSILLLFEIRERDVQKIRSMVVSVNKLSG